MHTANRTTRRDKPLRHLGRFLGRFLGYAALALTASVQAVEDAELQRFGRYLPLYPGLYANASLAHDPRNAVFDQNGDERGSTTPNSAGNSEFPETRAALSFQWYFPMFESDALPFFSGRLHTARMTFRAVSNDTEGDLDTFIDNNGLENNASGVGDLTLEFGSFLLGSENWRERKTTPFALLALVGVTLPTGEYDVDAPTNAGSNEFSFHGGLGAHWQPADGWLVDGGLAYKTFDNNEEPAFGAQAPAQLGDLVLADLSVARRLPHGLYLSGFLEYQDGDANEYKNPRFAVNPPVPAAGMENVPTPGRFKDDGTSLLTAGVSLNGFLAQNWLAGVHVIAPLNGESGEFTLPFSSQVAGCRLLNNCMPAPSGQSVTVDGLGGARSYASNIVMVTLGYSFGRGDPWK